ncbi:MAG: glycosyltransferase [bacterium]|nr:glycosyltransferase [bacterium]
MTNTKPKYSFLIPVFNTGELLYETLDSIVNQTFDTSTFQIIIVDDCSTDSLTIRIIDTLLTHPIYKGLALTIARNKKNSWLAETRNVAARLATGEYLVCLDSDDTLEPDFIKHCHLAFAAYPNASWVYPSVRKFGYKNSVDIMPNFSSKQLFLSNYVVAVSPVKRTLWIALNGQKTHPLSANVKLFEDWDFWQRAIGKGYFGVPIKKIIFNYRQNIRSLITRSEDEGNLSTLLAYRSNWKSVFGLKYSQKNYEKNNDQFKSNFGFFSRILRKAVKLIFNRNPSNLRIGDLILFIFAPSIFAKRKASNSSSLTKAHKMAGFKTGFKLTLDVNLAPINDLNNTVICGHFWWHTGGAENILLDYVKNLSKNGFKVVDVVNESQKESGVLRSKFEETTDEQFALDEIADGPYPRLLALWELIKLEKPKIIFIMSNPFLYLLAPLIREKLPNTVIFDLLHCEEYDENGWFETAYNYQNHIHHRIVISDFWKKVLIEKYYENADKIHVVFNMIDHDSFTNKALDKRVTLNNLKIDSNKRIIGFLGRFHEQKRPDLFVDLVEKMANNSDYHFLMAGSGEMLEKLETRIKALPNLTYLGKTNSPEKILPLFDIAVFPSRFEGYALVSMECAHLSIPVIVPQINGFREQIENGNFGKMYEIINDNKDVEQIKDLITNHFEEIIELGKNGPDFIHKFHNKSKIENSLNQLFRIHI